MRITQLVIAQSVLWLGTTAFADVPEEREQLGKAQAELSQLLVRLTAAEAAADPDARIHFRYDWLRQDLERIRRGIQAHIDAPQGPGDRKTVCGDYRR